MSIIRYRTFGKPNRPTIYYLTGYTGRIKQYAAHIKTLNLTGFRVVAFEYDKSILNVGNPNLLIEALRDIVKFIDEDKKHHNVAGVYGVSLGSWLGANILVMCNIRMGMFNTGATSIARAVWESPRFAEEKKHLQQNDYTRSSLEKVWGPYEFTPTGRRWKGKQVLIMSSFGDEILNIDEVSHNVQSWQRSGDDVRLIVSRRPLSHTKVIVRNMLRLRKTPAFFR